MGAAKFPEEIVERFIEDGPVETRKIGGAGPSQNRPKPRLRYCPLCFEGYLEEIALDEHVARNHGKQHVYLRVNGRIIRDVCWLKEKVSECRLILLEVPPLVVIVQSGGKETRLTIQETTSLVDLAGTRQEEGAISIRTRGGPFSRSFTIYRGRQPDFRSRRIDDDVMSMMERIRQGRQENLVAFRDKWKNQDLNDMESRYLDGIIEYCHGWQLEMGEDRTRARGRLEVAMDLLMPFKTELAEDLRCALALRMNCFAGQWGCDEGSPFRLAESFFCIGQGTPVELAGRNRDAIIPLDQNTEAILEALEAYAADQDRRVFEILNTVRTGDRVRDRNDEDKLNLIEARTKARAGDRRGAVSVYELFLDHPLFGGEAKSQLDVLA